MIHEILGIKFCIVDSGEEVVAQNRYKRKSSRRWQKKWRKRFGTKFVYTIPTGTTVAINKFKAYYCNSRTYAALKAKMVEDDKWREMRWIYGCKHREGVTFCNWCGFRA